MNVDPHPRRELDSAATPDGLRDALVAAREAGPSAARMAAAREALLQRAATDALSSAGASTLGHAASHATSSLLLKFAAGAMVVGLFAGGSLLLGEPAVPSSEAAAPQAQIEHAPALRATERAMAPLAEPLVEPLAEPPVEPLAPFVEPITISAEASGKDASRRREPRRQHRAAERPRAHAAEPLARVAERPNDMERPSEVELLSRARALLQDRPAETVRIAAQHAELFPSGQFVQEREVLAVHALLREGERQAAVERGERFLVRYPSSTHAQRVARLLEEARR